MQKILNEFVKLYESDEDFQRKLDDYERVLKTPEWKFITALIMAMKNHLATDMFTARYTNLSPEDKDVQQRTYYNINEVLDFLIDPLRRIRRRNTFSLMAKRFSPKKGEK